MMKNYLLYILLGVGFFATAQKSPKVSVKVDTTKIRIGEQINYQITVDDVAGLTGLTSGPSIDGADTAYSPIDTLTIDNPQLTYDVIFKTGYKDMTDSTFSNIDFTPYE